jgi:coproporphyrinogen III oxidase-like Fe-S oxidoreductase
MRATRGLSPEDGRETLDAEAQALERVWLGLRTARGVPARNLAESARRLVTSWIDRGLARAEGAFVRLTPQGWLMLDQLAVELDQASSG